MNSFAAFSGRVRRLVTLDLERLWRSRTTWALVAAMLGVAVLVTFGATSETAAAAKGTTAPGSSSALRSVAALQVFVMLIGIVCVTSEYHHGDIVWRCLAEPSRAALVAAKAVACGLVGALLGLLALHVALGVALLQETAGLDGVGPATRDVLPLVVGSVVGAALAGVLGVGIGAVVRSQTAAVVGALVAVLLVEPALTALVPTATAFLPSAAARAAVGDAAAMAWSGGLLLFAAYALAAAAAGAVVTARIDV